MNLAFEAGNSKLLDVFSVADVDAEECIDASLVENLNLNFGQGFEAEDWSRFLANFWSFARTLTCTIPDA